MSARISGSVQGCFMIAFVAGFLGGCRASIERPNGPHTENPVESTPSLVSDSATLRSIGPGLAIPHGSRVGLIGADASWIGRPPGNLEAGVRCTAKVRYRQSDQDCVVTAVGDGRLRVAFDVRQRAVAPGQFVVFYDESLCLGGAVIDQIE